jgi:hypothetical protein
VSPKKKTKGAIERTKVRLKARGGHLRMTGARCVWCGEDIPMTETARTTATPPNHVPLPAGSAWVICGEKCKVLPEDAVVFYRVPIEQRK